MQSESGLLHPCSFGNRIFYKKRVNMERGFLTRKEIPEIINSPITGILLGSKVYQNLKSHRIPFLITTHLVLKDIERSFSIREGC